MTLSTFILNNNAKKDKSNLLILRDILLTLLKIIIICSDAIHTRDHEEEVAD